MDNPVVELALRGEAGVDDIRPMLIATVSHDLRSPLAAAMTAIDCLSYQSALWSSEEAVLVASARTSLAQISRLIEGLLDANRIQHRAATVQLLSTRLTDVVRAALSTVPEADRVTVDLPTGLPDVLTDSVLLERVIANVVANALRFSPPKTPPRLVADRRGSCIELRVMDNGPGVSRMQWEQLFQPFERLGEARSTSGLGLGLAISRTLADAMGASLHPESTVGGGLTMVIAVPLSPVR
jgi:two-component system, OmpR family, sensor histidine kinase KdpD